MQLFKKKEKTPKTETPPKPGKEAKVTLERELLEEERIYRKGVVGVIDLIAPASMKVEPSMVTLGSTVVRTIFIVTYPRYIGVGWSSPVINLSTTLDVGMFFYPVKSEVILKQLKKKAGALEAQILADTEKGAPRDPLRETALRDIEKLRDDLTQGVEHFFQYAFYVTVYAKSKEELDKTTAEIESVFGSKLIYTKKVFFQAEQGFNSTMPLGNDELMITFNMNTSPIAASFPFISSDLTSDNGVLFGINKHNNSLILFDRFSLQNGNACVFATSGSGKSVTGDTEVLIKDGMDTVRLIRIGDLIEELGRKHGFEPIDNELEGVINPALWVYTFNHGLRGEWSPVTVAARKVSPKDLYVFKTQSGRSITVTGDHNMLVLREGKVVAAKSDEVRLGEYLPIPTQIPEPTEPSTVLNLFELFRDNPRIYVNGLVSTINAHYEGLRQSVIDTHYDRYLYQYRKGRSIPISYAWSLLVHLGLEKDLPLDQLQLCSARHHKPHTSLPALLTISPELARLMGYIISEGTIGDDFVLISNTDSEVKQDIAYCLKEIGITYFNRASDGSFAIGTRVFVALAHALGLTGKAGAKRVPPILFNCSNKVVAEFIKAYFEGDGGVDGFALTACSKSHGLISGLSYLLLRFGIIARMRETKKTATNSGATGRYWILSISGQTYLVSFSQKINFVSHLKQTKLNRILNKKENTNVAVIPVQKLLQKLYELYPAPFRGLQKLIDLKNGAYQPSRQDLNRLLALLKERLVQFRAFQKTTVSLISLPHPETTINRWADNRATNRILWNTLGQSWRLMKNGEVSPGTINVLKAHAAVSGEKLDYIKIKNEIKTGFKLLGLSVKHFRLSLQTALTDQPESNTRYAHLFAAAKYVTQEYERARSLFPRLNEIMKQLATLAQSNLEWDPIVSIEKKASRDPYVYDLTVDNEVFLAGQGGLYVHNSYAVKLEVLRSLMLGTEVIVIDPEMEYKHLSDAVGGTYVNVSLASEAKINPFELPRPVGEEFTVEDIIRSAVITVKGLLRIMLGQVTPEEDSVLDRALLETYAKKDITPQADLKTVEPPILQDFVDVLQGMEGTNTLVIKLKKYTEGTFSGLLNSPTTMQMQNILVTFSVRDLEDELRPMAIYTIVNYIWNVVRSERKKRILVIDEAWWLMQHEDSAKFIFALVKRCRKYYLGVTTITQDVNDFLRSPYGQAIVNNSSVQILLKQSPAAIDLIQKTFLLTNTEKYYLLETGVGEGIFFAGPKHAAIKIIASYTEDQVITSDPRQLLEIEQAKKEYERSLMQAENK